jgi:hypothetical protein
MKLSRIISVCGLLALIGLLIVGCSSNESTDAKERVEKTSAIVEHGEGVKRPEPKVPHTDIDLSKLGETTTIEKLIAMTQLEASDRLGSYRFDATLAYTTGGDTKGIDLKDNYFYEQAPNRDFHIRTFNDKATKFELYWVGGKVYDRMGDVGFRFTKSDGKENYWREKISGGLNRFYRYYRGHLSFSAPKEISYEGRPALRIDFAVDPNGKTPEEPLEVKHPFPNQYLLSAMSVDSMIDKNRKRVSRFEKGDGYLVVDKQAAVIVAYELDARYVVPVGEERLKKMKEAGGEGQPTEVTFTMNAQYKAKDIGSDIVIVAPKEEPPVVRDTPPESVDNLLPKGVEPIKTDEAKPTPVEPVEPSEPNTNP